MNNMERRVLYVVANTIGRDLKEMNLDMTLEELEIDSLDNAEIMLELEEEFEIQIPDNVWRPPPQTINAYVNRVEAYLSTFKSD